MNQEIWKDIDGFKGKYKISNLGNIKSYAYGKEKKLKPYGKLYLQVKLNGKYLYIHKLVANAFIKNPNDYKVINHINGIKKDNRAENLEWCTYKHNTKEAFRLGLSKNGTGIKNGRSKSVTQYDMNGNFIKQWESARLAQENLKISHIIECCRNKRKSSGGYIWKYTNLLMEN